MTEPNSGRPESRCCTLADLLVLTVGAAIASSPIWYRGWVPLSTSWGRAAPTWHLWANQVEEILQKSCMALIAVILYRRWRHGGPIRPVEYLPILMGLSRIAYSTSKWPIFGIYHILPTIPRSTRINMEARHIWELAQIALGVLAALAVAIRRRRPPDWASGLLIAIAWNRLIETGGFLYQGWAYELVGVYNQPTPVNYLLRSALVAWPLRVAGPIPLSLALVDLVRPHRSRWTWIEWAALAIVGLLPVFHEAQRLARMLIGPRGLDFGSALHFASVVTAFGVSYALARRFEPAWRRWLGALPPSIT